MDELSTDLFHFFGFCETLESNMGSTNNTLLAQATLQSQCASEIMSVEIIGGQLLCVLKRVWSSYA